MLEASKKVQRSGSVAARDSTFAQAIGELINIQTYASQLKMKMQYLKNKRSKKEEEVGGIDAFMHMISLLFDIALKLTSLPAEEEHYSRSRCMLYPIPGMLFATWVVMRQFSFEWLVVGLTLGAML